jgi:uncharacterized membrane protein YphA (DoxX/SURF4 family)
MKVLRLISRIIIGILFIFSGTVKAIDPLGSAYKFSEYFRVFHIEFLQQLALPLAILLCSAEFIAGLSVLTGYRHKAGIWLVIILMLIFTPLTLVLAFLNPVSDCGCFGDAVHLTNWQTFIKNLVILFFVIVTFSGRKQMEPVRAAVQEWATIVVAGVFFIGFSLMNIRYLPLIDFLPYKPGVNIPDKMKIPNGKPADKYATTFIYEKNGKKQEFTIDNYPSNDSSWVFVEQKSVLVSKGYQPLIHDFSLFTISGEDLTQEVLNNRGYTLLMISKKLGEASNNTLQQGIRFGLDCHSKGIGFKVVTASGSDEIQNSAQNELFCMADETTLKTMLRANPGFMLLKEGTIMGKWSWAGLPPSGKFINAVLNDKPANLNYRRWPLYVLTGLLTSVVLLMLFGSFVGRKNTGPGNR